MYFGALEQSDDLLLIFDANAACQHMPVTARSMEPVLT